MPNSLPKIKYIVHLMLENRSFDQMLGFLYANKKTPAGIPFEGLTGTESNPDGTGASITIKRITAATPHAYFRPGADPGEGFYNTNMQLFGTQNPAPGQVATNSGFVANFKAAIDYDNSKHYQDSLSNTMPADIMEAYDPAMIPVMAALAKGFAVCDHWFSSAPTQTVPNRAFAAAATSQGRLDNHVKVFTCPSIFGSLSDKKLDWAIYGYSGEPLTKTDFPDTLQADPKHFGRFSDFVKRAKANNLPSYTFLEPDFGANGNSQHPNYDVSKGDLLIRDVYRALRESKEGWEQTLLIISYDEHGGNFDHVIPPTNATPPDALVGEFDNFDFKRFGIRVPALLISPFIQAGTVFRAAKGTIDHTSVLKTIEDRWGIPALTARDQAAASLGDVLTLAQPRTDDPLTGIDAPTSPTPHPKQSTPSELQKIHAWRLSNLPIPNAKGSMEHTPPPLTSSAEISDYIESRNATWNEHLKRIT